MRVDVAIVGGGPAGLAVAIGAARRGLSTLVLEARRGAHDKACGEGLLPTGVAALAELGVVVDESARLRSVRWIERSGAIAEAELRDHGALGIRRTRLVDALRARARVQGAMLREGVRVQSHVRTCGGLTLFTDDPEAPRIDAGILVAADGLASPLRRAEGLDVVVGAPRRFGMRRHFGIVPWSSSVEVHLGDDAEAYVTPVSEECVCIALLFGDARTTERVSFGRLLSRFPALAARVADAPVTSRTAGAGPFARAARRRVAERFALVGDAAGYVDAVTGEGLSLAFRAAASLSEVLPDALVRGGDVEVLARYERQAASDFRRYAWVTRAMLGLTRARRLHPMVLAAISRAPRALNAAVAWAT